MKFEKKKKDKKISMNINHFQPKVSLYRVIKTENNVAVPSNSISLRTKFKKKKKCREHRSLSSKSRAVPIIK